MGWAFTGRDWFQVRLLMLALKISYTVGWVFDIRLSHLALCVYSLFSNPLFCSSRAPQCVLVLVSSLPFPTSQVSLALIFSQLPQRPQS
ncbi:hypothetical protein BU16DRAFT_356580 [Lophium mytilinum]|uniref:Uncharacterized protein n=1 Tax=Lophium mytilinum TaxID=390894 RepID=A0A6A6QTQ3_9PEZI|nr:hypothetical protein BU16DRAFT_356580 [Lophium mytilinum]